LHLRSCVKRNTEDSKEKQVVERFVGQQYTRDKNELS
jgi:hypothetical protein